jgi:hypothetical protein
MNAVNTYGIKAGKQISLSLWPLKISKLQILVSPLTRKSLNVGAAPIIPALERLRQEGLSSRPA